MPASTATELWDLSGVSLASLNQVAGMSAKNLVHPEEAGFDKGEAITLRPSTTADQYTDGIR